MFIRDSHSSVARRSIFIVIVFSPVVVSVRRAIKSIMRPSMLLGVFLHIFLCAPCALLLTIFSRFMVKMSCLHSSLKKYDLFITRMSVSPLA